MFVKFLRGIVTKCLENSNEFHRLLAYNVTKRWLEICLNILGHLVRAWVPVGAVSIFVKVLS